MSSQDALMFDVLRPKKAAASPRSNLSLTKQQRHQQTPAQLKTDRLPLQNAPHMGNSAAYTSYRDQNSSSEDGSSEQARWNEMSMDCDIGNENGDYMNRGIVKPSYDSYHSLADACEQAKARTQASFRMGLTASHSGHSVASSAVSESSYDDESELSRSLESTGNCFPATPARGTYPGRLPHFDSDSTYQISAEDGLDNARRGSGLNCSPRSGPVLSSSLLFRELPQTTSSPSPATTATTGASKLKSGNNVPITASPLSGRVNLPHLGEDDRANTVSSSSNRSSLVGTSSARLSVSGPSNLAARRKLPSLAIAGTDTSASRDIKRSMPHTPGGSVFAGARDGAATGNDSPVSPFMPPTPFVVACGDRLPNVTATPARNVGTNYRKPGSLSDVHTGYPSSPLLRQGSLGPMSPLSRDFAAVSVQSDSSANSAYSGGSSQDSASTSLTTLTPPMSPVVSSASGKPVDVPAANSHSPPRLGSSRPTKLTKSKSTNRVAPYPSRESTSADGGSSASSSSPRKLKDAKNVINSLRLSPVDSSLQSQTMEKSLSAPQPRAPEPKTVSGKTLSTRTLHPVFAASYTLGDELGSGGFGFVVGAHRNFDGRPVAVKFIWKNKVPSHGWVRDPTMGVIPLEAFVLRVVDHPCVVKFIDLFDDDEFFYLVMEMHGTPWKAPEMGEEAKPEVPSPESNSAVLPPKSPGIAVFAPGSLEPCEASMAVSTSPKPQQQQLTQVAPQKAALAPPQRPAPMERRTSRDLFECIEQHTRFSEDVASWIFAQIVEAVYYLGQLGICHRDIKDENCVIDSDWNVKIIDFGSAVISDPRKPAPYFDRFFGTMTFASSEILQGRQYRAPHAEVWSLGVLLSILLSGECPFSEPAAAVKGRISSRVKNSWSAEAYNLLCGCVQVDPERRATIAQVRDHPWVRRAWERKGLRRPSAPQIF